MVNFNLTGVDWSDWRRAPINKFEMGPRHFKIRPPSKLGAEAKSVASGTLATGRFGNSGCLDDSLTITRDHSSNMKEESV